MLSSSAADVYNSRRAAEVLESSRMGLLVRHFIQIGDKFRLSPRM